MNSVSEVGSTTVEPVQETASLENVKEDPSENGSISEGLQSRLRYLEPGEFALWDKLVDASPQGSPFARSWWLRAVGGDVRILTYFKDSHLVAGIPLYSEKRFGVTVFTMPKLTQVLGPVMAPLNGRRVNASWEEMEILSAFAAELSKKRIFFQAFHPSVQNWSPFYWNGFRQTSRATQVLDLRQPDKLWAGMAKAARRHIRKAEHLGLTVQPCSAEVVWQAEQKTFARQHLPMPHSMEYLGSLYRAAKDNDGGECLAAIDGEQNVHSAGFMIWDHTRAYAIATGSDPELRVSGATSLLLWHMIQMAAQRAPVIDFAGSMMQPVELFQRSFGAAQVPYSWIMKFPVGLRLYLTLRGKL